MAKDVKFKIDLIVDGKQHLVEATTNSSRLAHELGLAVDKATAFKEAMGRWANAVMGIAAVQSSINSLVSEMDNLTKESNDYDKAMRAANTMAGKGADEFGKLKDQVTGLSKTIPVTRDALANGLYQVISNGVPEKNWMSFLEASAKSSVGGIADLGQVVGVTSTIIKNYGLEWEAAQAIQDKIQLTAKNGVTSFEQLAAALPKVSSNAATLGVSIDELMATFATLTGVSGNTAEVSTQLAAIFTALIKPSSEATKMAEAMGIQFNAAAIQAAGGLQQFLTKLDASVKTYASARGILEKEVYGKLFGSAESLRAIGPLTGNLANTFQKNIATMADSAGTMDGAFGEMASTAEAKAQLVKNSFAGIRDFLANIFGTVTPYLSFISTIGMITLSMESMRKSAMALWLTMKNGVLVTGIVNMATKAYNATLMVFRTATTWAAAATTALGAALRTLLIASGVVGIVMALGSALYSLFSSSKDAADGLDEMSEAEQRAKAEQEQLDSEITRINGQLTQHISICKNFKGTKEEEKKIVQELNNTYGSTLGYFSSVSAWYKTLTANSKEYSRQMINEAKARQIANQIAKIDQEIYDLNYDENGNQKQYSQKNERKFVQTGTTSWGQVEGYYEEIPRSSAAWQNFFAVRRLYNRRDALENQLNDLNSQTYDYVGGGAVTPPTGSGTGKGNGKTTTAPTKTDNTPKLTENAITYKQLTENVRYYQAALENANITDRKAYEELVRKKAGAEAAVEAYNRMVESIVETEKYDVGAETIEDMTSNIEILRKQLARTEPNSEPWQAITDEIEMWQNRIDGVSDMSDSALERSIAKIDQRLKNEDLDIEAAVELTTTRNELQKQLDDKAKEVYFKANIEGKNNNIKEIDDAINFYTERQQEEDADQIRKTQDIIDGLTKKKRVFELSIDLATKSREIREIEELTEKDRKIEIRGIGFDELANRIRELNKLLSDKSITDSQRKEIQDILGVYKDWQKESLDTFGALKDGWGGIKGIGSGFKSMTDSLKGNADAWSKVTSIVDGFISIYDGVQSVIKIIEMLTTLSEAHTVAKAAESVMVSTEAGVETAASTDSVDASVANSVAAKAETAAYMELAAAKYFAAHAYIPFAGYGIAAGFALAAKATTIGMGAIGAFAEGGIAFGPTVGLFGEYAGARSNPEVVAPLDRLTSLIQPQGLGGDVRFKIKGNDLEGVLEKVQRKHQRT